MKKSQPLLHTALVIYLALVIFGDGITGVGLVMGGFYFYGLWLIVMACSAAALLNLRKWGFYLYSGMATLTFIALSWHGTHHWGTLASPIILYILLTAGSPREIWKELK